MRHLCHTVADTIMVVGVLIILMGIVKTLVWYVAHEKHHFGKINTEGHLDRLRSHLGAYLLLGLEFGVAADIMITVLDPDVQGLIILGGLVVIRTVISYFVGKEREEIHRALTPAAEAPPGPGVP